MATVPFTPTTLAASYRSLSPDRDRGQPPFRESGRGTVPAPPPTEGFTSLRDEGIFAELNYDLTGPARVKEGRKPEPTASVIDIQGIKASANVPLTVATFTTVCLLGWMLSYGALRYAASYPFSQGLSELWPAIVYGPWLAGCLSVLRAAAHGHRVTHSWATVILFSCFSMALSIAAVPRTLPDMLVVGLPALSSVVSLHQVVRQLTSSRNEKLPGSHRAGRAFH